MIRPAHSVLRLILISGKIYEASCLFFQSILASSFCFRQSTPHFHVLIALRQVRLLPSFVSRRVFYFQNLNPECVNLTLPTEPVSHPQFIGGLSSYVSYLSRDAFPSAFLLPGTLAAIIERGWGSLWLARTHDAPTRTDDLNFRAQRQGRDHGSR